MESTAAELFMENAIPFAAQMGDPSDELMPSWKKEEKDEGWSAPRIVLGSFLGFSLLFILCSSCTKIFKSRTRPKGFSFNVSQIIVSETQAVIAAFTGFKIVLQTWSDCVMARSPLTNPYSMVFVGYLLYDLVIMYLTDWRVGKRFFEIIRSQFTLYCHHFAFIFVVPPVSLYLREGKGDHFIGCFLIMEFPVIFLHFQHFLSVFGLSGSKAYIINGILTIISYFFCRIAIFPLMFYRMAARKGVSFMQIHKHMGKSCIIGSVVCVAMQLYWFYLMIRKACRVQKKARNEITEEHVDKKKL